MAKYDDEFNASLDLDSLVIVSENACAGMDEAVEFKVPLTVDDVVEFEASPYAATEASWHLSFSEDLHNAERFNQLAVNSLPYYQHNVCTQSAFCKYTKAYSMAAVNSFKTGQILLKRCLGFLRKIEKKRNLTTQMSMQTVPAPPYQHQQAKSGFQNKSTFGHMLAERNRRIKLRQHFSNLCSFLPQNSKKDNYSILANTINNLKELKLRVAKLEQENQILQELVFPNNEERSRGFESTDQPYYLKDEFIYRSNEVTLEQCKDVPSQVNMKVTVQKDQYSCPTSLLIKQLDLMKRKQLEVLSIQTHTEPFQFYSNILLRPNGEAWNVSQWQNFGITVRVSLMGMA
ncbi:hypothetical protein SUGI_0441190 [Cryptomeria japonica]|uniref:uncharacterized protein LOC131032076 n=1 Tax=Cryptomeria japonica TaxID=3369 RepID=UPI002408D131|nr:uncharacterized protein LOC131032076 [Cryptomeria japonica]GLJ23319.1 hypothetical protein SUGI_0441190 [Cryptomeria japonica]